MTEGEQTGEMTVEAAFTLAEEHHQAGRLPQAEAIYRAILAAAPEQAETLHMLGLLAHQTGNQPAAIDLIRRALAQDDGNGVWWSNLSAVCLGEGQLAEAEEAARRAVAIDPDFRPAVKNLSFAVKRQGRVSEAIDLFHRVVALGPGPGEVDVLVELGASLHLSDRTEEAVACYEQVLALRPDHVVSLYNLGHARQHQGRTAEAVALYDRVLALCPDHAQALLNLAIIHHETGRYDLAVSLYERALVVEPDNYVLYYNYANTCIKLGLLQRAHELLDRTLALEPGFAYAHMTMGNAHHAGGRLDLALPWFEKALVLKPDFADAHNNVLATLRVNPDTTGADLVAECRRWDAQQAVVKVAAAPHDNDPDPERRLRIGYVSPDFREHALSYFLRPLFGSHDPAAVEVHGYASVARPDAITDRFRSLVPHWRNIHGMDDDAAAALIRSDGIDILIDCAGHTIGHRLMVFARRPAPVQLSSLIGHESTVGLRTLDYMLADPILTPPGYEDHFVETLVRLPRVVAPFAPNPDWAEAVPEPPAGPVVIGCFTEPVRIGRPVLALWRRILDRLPGARFLFKHGTYGMPGLRAVWQDIFAESLDGRVDLEDIRGGWKQHMDVYGRVTLMMDSFPVSGATTCLIPMWMGVPVITLAGVHSGQRFGASMITNAGFPELVAASADAYVDLAVTLAQDRRFLVDFRRRSRDTMRASALFDAVGVTREIEAAYRDMWRTWCRGRTGSHS
ncbi:MAG: tetratricopeptide repeat protein [Alphaproteobacteria bacterium]